MEDELDDEKSTIESVHIQSDTCNCCECQEKRSKYITILDVDKYIDSLNDWDWTDKRKRSSEYMPQE